MTGKSVDVEKWRNQIKKHLGKHCARFTIKIACDVMLVDVGLKTSFLFDYACISADNLNYFVMDIKKEKLVMSDLTVIKVEDDAFVCNMQSDRRDIHERNIIDVSGHLKEPTLVDDGTCNKTLKTIVLEIERCLTQLEHNRNSILELEFSEVVNRTTAFGYLLDYPVLYWYGVGCEENCLSMVPSRNIKVIVQIGADYGDNKEHVAWSFSYPECFHQLLSAKVTAWFHRITQLCEKQAIFENVTLQEETVLLPHVAL